MEMLLTAWQGLGIALVDNNLSIFSSGSLFLVQLRVQRDEDVAAARLPHRLVPRRIPPHVESYSGIQVAAADLGNL